MSPCRCGLRAAHARQRTSLSRCSLSIISRCRLMMPRDSSEYACTTQPTHIGRGEATHKLAMGEKGATLRRAAHGCGRWYAARRIMHVPCAWLPCFCTPAAAVQSPCASAPSHPIWTSPWYPVVQSHCVSYPWAHTSLYLARDASIHGSRGLTPAGAVVWAPRQYARQGARQKAACPTVGRTRATRHKYSTRYARSHASSWK